MCPWKPGGQLELSGAPLDNIHQTCDEVNQHLREVRSVAEGIGGRVHRAGGRTDLVARPDARHAQGPLQADDRLHGPRGHHGENHDVSHLHGSGESRFRVRGRHGAKAARPRWRCNPWPPRCLRIRPFWMANPTAIKAGARGSGAIWTRRAPACCPSCLKTVLGSSLGWNTRSMCRCISSTAMANILTRWGSPSAISCAESCPRFPAKSRRCRIGPTI